MVFDLVKTILSGIGARFVVLDAENWSTCNVTVLST